MWCEEREGVGVWVVWCGVWERERVCVVCVSEVRERVCGV